ncbi:MAG: hypothetical protein CMJ31_09585 [Phycisphaerae bacterium]|nr:hypothetical protein [Phycisphaerae bacterium]
MAYGLGAAGLLLIAVSFHLWMLRRAREATSELTFRRMALARGVPPRRRRLVRRLAELHNGADPIALLMSDHAMQRAAARFRTSGAPYPAGTSVKDLEKLLTNKAWPALAKE